MATKAQRRGLIHGDSQGNIRKAKRGRVIGTYSAEPDGVNVTQNLKVPPANGVFTAAELDKRIEFYQKCVEARVPCTGAPAPPPPAKEVA